MYSSYRTTTANVPFYQLATQTDAAGTRALIKDTFKKCFKHFGKHNLHLDILGK
jgi:hypothetical protein